MKSLKGLWCVLWHGKAWRLVDWRRRLWKCTRCGRGWDLSGIDSEARHP